MAIAYAVFLTLYGALSAIGIYGATGIAIANVLTYALIYGAVTGLSYAANSLLAGKSDQQSSLLQNGHLVNAQSQTEPIKIIYGKTRVGCNRVFVHTGGAKNKYLNKASIIGEGPIEGIFEDSGGELIYLDDRRSSFYEAYKGFLPNDLYDKTIYKGTFNQPIDPMMSHATNGNPNWADAMPWTAYAAERLKSNTKAWAQLPNSTFLVLGRKLFDPRTGMVSYYQTTRIKNQANEGVINIDVDSTTGMAADKVIKIRLDNGAMHETTIHAVTDSDTVVIHDAIPAGRYAPVDYKVEFDGPYNQGQNSSLVWYDYMRHRRYSRGIPFALIDTDSVIAGANKCDSEGWHFNGSVMDRKPFIDNLIDIESCFRGGHLWSEGKYYLKILDYDTPVRTLDESQIGANPDQFVISEGGISEIPDRLTVFFCDPLDNYISKPLPLMIPGIVSSDMEDNPQEMAFIGITDYQMAFDMGAYHLKRMRASKIFKIPCHPRTIFLDPFDMVQVTHSFPGWTNQVLRVMSQGIPQQGLVPIAFMEESSDLYTGSGITVASHGSYQSTLPDPNQTLEEPINVNAETGADEETKNKVDAYIEFICDNVGPGFDYEWQWRQVDDPKWDKKTIKDPNGEIPHPTATVTGALIMTTDGEFTGAATLNYRVEIDGVGSPNTLKYSIDGGSTWEATGIAITGDLQDIDNGVKIHFSELTGGMIGDHWDFTCVFTPTVKFREGKQICNQEFFYRVRTVSGKQISDWAYGPSSITAWAPDIPSMDDVALSVVNVKNVNKLTWTKGQLEAALDQWLIYRNTVNDSATAELIEERSRSATSFKDTGAIGGQTYYYWLKAKDIFERISTTFSNVASTIFYHDTETLTFTTIPEGSMPMRDGTVGYIANDPYALHDCDNISGWTQTASVVGSIVLSPETIDVKEGTGALKVELFRYAKVRYYEDGVGIRNLGSSSTYKNDGQSFKLSAGKAIKAIGVKILKIGSPPDITLTIYSDSGGHPGAELASTTILASSIGTTIAAPPNDYTYGVFGTPCSLSASTKYWFILSVPTTGANHYHLMGYFGVSNKFGDSDEGWDAGSTIAGLTNKPTSDLDFRVCEQGDALNKYFFVEISSQDLSAKTYLKNWLKSNRTGAFLSHSFGEADIGEQNIAFTLSEANTWELKSSDISGITGTSRDAVTHVGFKITNMDQDVILLIDDIFANIAAPHPNIRIDGVLKRFVLEDDPSIAPGIVVLRPTGGDDTDNFKAAFLESKNRILQLIQGTYRITSKVSDITAGTRIIRGMGAAFNDTVIPTSPKGTVIVWDGDPSDTMFEFGGDPLYIAGVWQGGTTWQNNVSLEDFTIHANKGAQSLVYVHDQDNFKTKGIFVNGFQQAELRGVFDLRGTISNPSFKGVTVYDVTRGYAFRCGDAFANARFEQCCAQKTPLGWWFSDCKTYERPWPDGMTEWVDCTFEGVVITGQETEPKWKVDTLNGSHSVGTYTINVAHGSYFSVGDNIFIDRGPDKFEMNYVTQININALTVKFPAEYTHSNGAIIKAGTIGLHCGGSYSGFTTTVTSRHCMFNWVGCGFDVHSTDNITVDMPIVPGGIKRLMYLDGNVFNTYLLNPDIWPKTYTDYKIWEITSRGGVFDFNWYGKPDQSGQTEPYINSQGEGDFNYIGSFQQTEGASSMPPWFRGITFDSIGGISIEDALPASDANGSAPGLFYKTRAVYGGATVKRTVLKVDDYHGVTLNQRDSDHSEMANIFTVDPFVKLQYKTGVMAVSGRILVDTLTADPNKLSYFGAVLTGTLVYTAVENLNVANQTLLFKTLVNTTGSTWVENETFKVNPFTGLVYKSWVSGTGFKTPFTVLPSALVGINIATPLYPLHIKSSDSAVHPLIALENDANILSFIFTAKSTDPSQPNDLIIQSAASKDIHFMPGGVIKVTMLSTGYTGFGTAVPTKPVEVVGAALISSAGSGAYLEVKGAGDANNLGGIQIGSPSSYWGLYAKLGGSFSIESGASTLFNVKATGEIGIGTTGQLAKLAVNGGVHVGGDSDPGDNNLLVDGTVKIAGGTPGLGKVLTSDADGLASWATSSAGSVSNVDYAIINADSDGSGVGNVVLQIHGVDKVTVYNNGSVTFVAGITANTLSITTDALISGTLSVTTAINEAGTPLSSKYAYIGGGNASGTWNINILGSAASAGSATYATSAGSAGYATSSGNADTTDGYHFNQNVLTNSNVTFAGLTAATLSITTSGSVAILYTGGVSTLDANGMYTSGFVDAASFKAGGTVGITGTYTVGARLTPSGNDGTITVKAGIITAVTPAT